MFCDLIINFQVGKVDPVPATFELKAVSIQSLKAGTGSTFPT
jgi:hypothetical protein